MPGPQGRRGKMVVQKRSSGTVRAVRSVTPERSFPMPSQCTIPDCARKHYGRGYCAMHHRRWQRHGHPGTDRLYVIGAAPNRFWQHVSFGDGCWEWLAYRQPNGYGQFAITSSKNVPAHRWAYEFCVGPIPAGYEPDHLCRNRACVNPDHIEPVTHRENGLRGIGPAAINARKTHCLEGHLFAGANLYVRPDGTRECRICMRRRDRKRRMRVG